MSSVRGIVLSFLLLAVSLSQVIVDMPDSPQNQSLVGAKNNPVDFEVTGIEVGNQSLSPRVWTQPDSSLQEYMTKGETIQINVKALMIQ